MTLLPKNNKQLLANLDSLNKINPITHLQMKSNLLFTLILFFCYLNIFAQNDSLTILKIQGKLKGNETIIKKTDLITPIVSALNPTTKAVSACQCWIDRDATWSIAQFDASGASGGPGLPPDYRNDDWTTSLLALPFTFCFYGSNQTNFYLNNNGNISFGAPYYTFTATGFPSTLYEMIAPFWGDVDTRNIASGIVYYKITPTALLVQWENVGYFNMHADKKNTFQLIITNGSDPLIPDGNNVSFCYKDMQWTTGDASAGVGGFGGFPATVGANKGDGVNYIQFGTFDQPGSAYDGPFVGNDGIDWLDNKSLFFNTCSSSNIPPIANGMGYCDTMKVCVGDTLEFNILFMSPELGQTTTVLSSTTLSGYSIVSNTPANNVNFSSQLIAAPGDIGFNTITFTATDDGTPLQTTNINVIIEILAKPDANAGNDTTICFGPVTLNATGGTIYTWTPSTGLSNPNIPNPVASPTVTTSYIVEVSNGACSDYDTIIVSSGPALTISPDQNICLGETASIFCSSAFTYSWSPSTGLNNTTISNPSANPSTTTTYTVTITDASGCSNTASVTVTVDPTIVSSFTISPAPPYYINTLINFTDAVGTANNWTLGDGTTSTLQSVNHSYLVPGTYTVCHELISTGCVDIICKTFEVLPFEILVPNVITPNGDGQNDYLSFQYLEYYPGSKIEIYNRWGNKLYETNDYKNNWDGTKFSDGTYYFILYQNKKGETKTIPGFFQLIRKK